MSGKKPSPTSSFLKESSPSSSAQPPEPDSDKKTGTLSTAAARVEKPKRKRKLPSATKLREKMRKLNAQQSETLQKAGQLEEKVDMKKQEKAASSSKAQPDGHTQQEIEELMDSVGDIPFLE